MNCNYLRTMISAGLMLLVISVKAQTNIDWQLVTLNVHDGTNSWNGVEGYCALTTCNGSPRLLLKLVNNNPYTVRAGWKDCVMIKGDDSRHPGNFVQDSVTIPAKSEISGECGGKHRQLVLDLSDFGTDAEDFNGMVTTDFDFIVIH